MAEMSDFMVTDGFEATYNELYKQAEELGSSVRDRLEQLLPGYIWDPERDDIELTTPRIKRVGSTSKKIQRKKNEGQVNIDATDREAILEHVEDLVGLRIIVSSKRYFQRLVKMIREDHKMWDVLECKAHTQDAQEITEFDGISVPVDSGKRSGYCGIHFVLAVHGKGTDEVRKVEIQIRTRFQDAWQSFEHPIYKLQDKIPSLTDLRRALAKESEAIAEAYEKMSNLARQFADEKGIDPNDMPYGLRQWDEHGEPNDYLYGLIYPVEVEDMLFLVIENYERIAIAEGTAEEILGKDWKEYAIPLPTPLVAFHFANQGLPFESLDEPDQEKYRKRLIAHKKRALSQKEHAPV